MKLLMLAGITGALFAAPLCAQALFPALPTIVHDPVNFAKIAQQYAQDLKMVENQVAQLKNEATQLQHITIPAGDPIAGARSVIDQANNVPIQLRGIASSVAITQGASTTAQHIADTGAAAAAAPGVVGQVQGLNAQVTTLTGIEAQRSDAEAADRVAGFKNTADVGDGMLTVLGTPQIVDVP